MKLTKQKKLDKRYNTTEVLNRWFNKYTAAAAMWGFIIGSLISMYFALDTKNNSPNALETQVEVKAVEVTKTDDYYKAEPLRYIRWRGQQLGYKDTDISVFVRIARAESNFQPMVKNRKSTATGIYQFIHGTFHAYCKGKNVYNFIDNIDCFYKVLEVDGFPKGLSHWNASKAKWNK
jgi:hypothetical protein